MEDSKVHEASRPDTPPARRRNPDSQPLVSIVTPAYNAEQHLSDCVESVLKQTYSNWNYTIVNNCSSDATAEVAERLAASDSRIRVKHNTDFLEMIANHNEAFRQVSSDAKYCKVVAADDVLFPHCVEEMVRVAEEHPRVRIVGSYAVAHNLVRYDGIPYPKEHIAGRDACRDYLLGDVYYLGLPSSLLYRAEIVRSRNDFYNEMHLHADTEVCLEFLEDAEFGFVHQVLCYTRVRPDSATSYAKRMETYRYSTLQLIIEYGARYMDAGEYREVLTRKLRNYRRFLGRQYLRRREPEFWEYHYEKLAELGYPLSRIRLVGYALRAGLEHILCHPIGTVRRLLVGRTT